MVHGGAGHVQRERCWPNSPYTGDNATLAPLLLGVVPQVVLMALEHRSLTESGSGGPGTLRTSHRSPMSSSTSARSPCSPPQRSFLSCPTAVPGLEESRAVAPHSCRTHRTDWGSAACSWKKRSLSQSRACSQPAAQGREEESQLGGRREETGGGSWRREGGGAGDPTRGWVEKVRFAGYGPVTLIFYSPRAPTPFSFPPLCGQVWRTGSLGSSGSWEEYVRKRIGACRELKPRAGLSQGSTYLLSASLGQSTQI